MASNTENLNLLMKNPSTDGADTFNVQTMLNENWQKIDNNAGAVAQTLANILKPTTPPIIGLPPSTTPDGMFQALGNTGELHVWRKTVVTKEPVPEVPAGYTLGTKTNTLIATSDSSQASRQPAVQIVYADSVSVDNSGNVSISGNLGWIYVWEGDHGGYELDYSAYRGKFIQIYNKQNANLSDVKLYDIYYVPSNAAITKGTMLTYGVPLYIELQTVTGYPYTPEIPAGTTTTYPVSTNPDAYQEGDDAKAAGYVLGDVENTTLVIAYRQNTVCNFSYSDALYVADDGSISLANPTSGSAGGSYNGAPTYLSGKFLKFVSISGNGGTTLNEGVIYYIPSNATIKIGSYAGYVDAEIDRYQPVTGYAAIPAGTIIEYMGKLGDKARVQAGSYVGTGTYGSSNPCSITANFKIKFAVITNAKSNSSDVSGTAFFLPFALNETYTRHAYAMFDYDSGDQNQYNNAKKSKDGKTLYWYNQERANDQMNVSSRIYFYVLFG